MQKLSKDRLNELKRSRNLTAKVIAQKTGIPKSTVEKIFGGFNKNPTIENLQKIANVLDCSIDDFLEYETDELSPFFMDKVVVKYAQYLYEKPQVRKLIDEVKKLDDADIELLISIAARLNEK